VARTLPNSLLAGIRWTALPVVGNRALLSFTLRVNERA
jgi:hypothetical protein